MAEWSGWDSCFSSVAEGDDGAEEGSVQLEATGADSSDAWGLFSDNVFLRSPHAAPENAEPPTEVVAFAAGVEPDDIMPEPESKRKRGRPKGTTGSAQLRKAEKAAAEALAKRKAERQQSLLPKPGSIEHARRFRHAGQGRSSSGQQRLDEGMCDAKSPVEDLMHTSSPVWRCLEDLGSSNQQALVLAAKHAVQKGNPSSWQESAVAQVLDVRATAVMSDKAVRMVLTKTGEQPPADVAHNMILGASAAVMAGGLLWGGCLQAVRSKVESGEWRPILVMDKMRYDETPLRVRVTDKDSEISAADSEVSNHAKVLQLEQSWYMVLQDQQSPSKKYFVMTGRVPVTLQVVDRMTAECLLAAIDVVRDVTPDWLGLTNSFSHRLRLAVPCSRILQNWSGLAVRSGFGFGFFFVTFFVFYWWGRPCVDWGVRRSVGRFDRQLSSSKAGRFEVCSR